MGQSTTTLCYRMRRSSGISKNCSTRGTSVLSHHLTGGQSCWYRRKIESNDSELIIGPLIKSQL
jgi:hypothetical protein